MLEQVELDHLSLMQKRIEFLIGARVRDRKRIHLAVQSIGRLQRKAPKNWNSIEEIRRWRAEE